ncbi:MAG: NAD(P)-binding domain-containing protein [Mycobacterium sp.]|uniref:NAD(P)-binding domain-containing protein n=1 Tax=Mycobacterium sp. TaxID=1785 RepID=UPI003CC5EB32
MGIFHSPSKHHRTVSLDVCVIGAGASGLVVMKELLDEGHVVSCYEKADRQGGLFRYSPSNGGVYDSTLLTISNNFMAFSSFPPRDYQTPRYWRHAEYLDYLRLFAEKFHLPDRINFNSEVVSVRKENQKVLVEIQTSTEGLIERSYDAVAICVGAHQLPSIPAFPGRDRFKGSIEHTYNYKNSEPYHGKDVLCIGAGETAADVVHEIAAVANSCALSLRHYPSIVLRYPFNRSFPNDSYTSRILHTNPRRYITKIYLQLARRDLNNPQTDPVSRVVAEWMLHEKDFFSQFLTKNEVFLEDVVSGKVPVNVSGIKEITATGAVFNDGTRVTADTIICNTGYVDDFSFVKNVDIRHARQLYRHMFHPDLGASVAFIGWARPAEGGVPACSEMQSRYFALLCSNKRTLPPRETLEELIRRENGAEEAEFAYPQSVKTLVLYLAYMDALADLIGCKPNPLRLLTRPFLLYKYWCASLLNSQYRLRGPHADPESAERVIRNLAVPWDISQLFVLAIIDVYSVLMKGVSALLGKRQNIYYS